MTAAIVSTETKCLRPLFFCDPALTFAKGFSEMIRQSLAYSQNCLARLISRATVAIAYLLTSHSR